jgi:hypothetical protein
VSRQPHELGGFHGVRARADPRPSALQQPVRDLTISMIPGGPRLSAADLVVASTFNRAGRNLAVIVRPPGARKIHNGPSIVRDSGVTRVAISKQRQVATRKERTIVNNCSVSSGAGAAKFDEIVIDDRRVASRAAASESDGVVVGNAGLASGAHASIPFNLTESDDESMVCCDQTGKHNEKNQRVWVRSVLRDRKA